MVKAFLIEKTDISKQRLHQVLDTYQDLNTHTDLNNLERGLITILTDQPKNILAIDLAVDGNKLQEVDFRGKRVSHIKTVIFCFDDPEIELTAEYIGQKLYKAYCDLIEESRSSSRIKPELDVSLRKEKSVDKLEVGKMADLSSVKEFLIPKWTVQDPNGLESFISELQSAKDMDVLSSDSMLIYAAMVKSGKSDMLEALTAQQKADLTAFVTYPRSAFGPTEQERRLGFQRIKQEDSEDCVNFFLRTEKHYFRSKNMTKPTGNDFLQQYKEDIRFQYVQGLKDPEVKRLMVLNTTAMQYDEIATNARNYSVSLKLSLIHI